MGKIQDDNRVDQVFKEIVQMPTQADSVATDATALKADFNALLKKLKDQGLMKK